MTAIQHTIYFLPTNRWNTGANSHAESVASTSGSLQNVELWWYVLLVQRVFLKKTVQVAFVIRRVAGAVSTSTAKATFRGRVARANTLPLVKARPCVRTTTYGLMMHRFLLIVPVCQAVAARDDDQCFAAPPTMAPIETFGCRPIVASACYEQCGSRDFVKGCECGSGVAECVGNGCNVLAEEKCDEHCTEANRGKVVMCDCSEYNAGTGSVKVQCELPVESSDAGLGAGYVFLIILFALLILALMLGGGWYLVKRVRQGQITHA